MARPDHGEEAHRASEGLAVGWGFADQEMQQNPTGGSVPSTQRCGKPGAASGVALAHCRVLPPGLTVQSQDCT